MPQQRAAGRPLTPGTVDSAPPGVGAVSAESPHRAGAAAGGTEVRGGGGKGGCPNSGSQRERQTLPTPTKVSFSPGAPAATEAPRKREGTWVPPDRVWRLCWEADRRPGCAGARGQSQPGTVVHRSMKPRRAKRPGHLLARGLSPRVCGRRPSGTCSAPGHAPAAGLGTQPRTVRPSPHWMRRLAGRNSGRTMGSDGVEAGRLSDLRSGNQTHMGSSGRAG